jgi:signal peptidase II
MAILTVAVFGADQATKAVVRNRIPDRAVIPIVRGFFNLTSTQNAGAVFGLFSDSHVWWKTPLLITISVALLTVVVYLVLRTQSLEWGTCIGLALVLGGALSNLFDRMRTGWVEDFLDFYVHNYHWATFNFADSAIVVGTGLIVVQVLFAD